MAAAGITVDYFNKNSEVAYSNVLVLIIAIINALNYSEERGSKILPPASKKTNVNSFKSI